MEEEACSDPPQRLRQRNPDKGTTGENRRRKATGPRFLRDGSFATKDTKTAELPKGRCSEVLFFRPHLTRESKPTGKLPPTFGNHSRRKFSCQKKTRPSSAVNVTRC